MAKYETLNPYDQWWIDRLDMPTLAAFEDLCEDKDLQQAYRKAVNKETARIIRRLMKQKGHILTPPEATDLANAIIDIRWVLERLKPAATPKKKKKKKRKK